MDHAPIDSVEKPTADQLDDQLCGLRDKAMKGGKAALDSVTTCIADYPIRSALIAVGVGALVGYLISRR